MDRREKQGWASVLFKRTFRSLRSFPFFIKERSTRKERTISGEVAAEAAEVTEEVAVALGVEAGGPT